MNTSKIYKDSEGNECSILQAVRLEPLWAANRIQEGEKAFEALLYLARVNKNWAMDVSDEQEELIARMLKQAEQIANL